MADQKKAPRGKCDALPGIGGIGLRPEYPRNDTEHCAAIERKAPGFDRMNFVTADFHDFTFSGGNKKQQNPETKKVGSSNG